MIDRRIRDRKRSIQRPTRKESLSGDIILIVCEGGKTEPTYFKGSRKEWRLHPANIEVVGEECGSAPISVVDFALKCRDKRKHEAKQGLKLNYDEIWCVFDHDKHESLDRAVYKAKSNNLKIALSVPCFEFWYLLHFKYTTQQFLDCNEVVETLKTYICNYDKSQAPLNDLLPYLGTAFENAQNIRKENQKTESKWPMTDVDQLVMKLKSMVR